MGSPITLYESCLRQANSTCISHPVSGRKKNSQLNKEALSSMFKEKRFRHYLLAGNLSCTLITNHSCTFCQVQDHTSHGISKDPKMGLDPTAYTYTVRYKVARQGSSQCRWP